MLVSFMSLIMLHSIVITVIITVRMSTSSSISLVFRTTVLWILPPLSSTRILIINLDVQSP